MVQSGSEPWWWARYKLLAALFERGAKTDLQLARVGLENTERSYPGFDENKFGMKDRFLALKEKILRELPR